MLSREELIGKTVIVHYSGKVFTGKIIDETKHTVVLEGPKTIIKQNATFEVDGRILQGKDIAKRPEERIKSK